MWAFKIFYNALVAACLNQNQIREVVQIVQELEKDLNICIRVESESIGVR